MNEPHENFEIFEDPNYYDMWCVRRKGTKDFNDTIHFGSREQAIHASHVVAGWIATINQIRVLKRFNKYRIEDVKSGEQFDAQYIYKNTEGGHMMSELRGKRVVRVTDEGEPHPDCAWGLHRVVGEIS